MRNNASDRLKRIVENDISGDIKNTLAVMRADLEALLSEFMNIKSLSVRVEGEDGAYRLIADADVSSIYSVGTVDPIKLGH